MEHTIVVRFPEGLKPTYSASTEFQGGKVVAVDFGGNRLQIEQELLEALEMAMEIGDGCSRGFLGKFQAKARAAIAKATAA